MPRSCVHTKGFRNGGCAYYLFYRDMQESLVSHIVIYNIVTVMRVFYVQLYFIMYYSVMVMNETCWLHGTILIFVMYYCFYYFYTNDIIFKATHGF